MLQDPLYANDVKCRWTTLRQTVLSDSALVSYIDSNAAALQTPAARHYQKWPILGTYVWPNNFIGQNYQDEINYLKTWIQSRTAWMDANMFGTCTASISEPPYNEITIAPNPTQNEILVSGLTGVGELLILDLSGKIVQQVPFQTEQVRIPLQQLQNGVYFIAEPGLGIYKKVLKN